jgi:hypothetical protein
MSIVNRQRGLQDLCIYLLIIKGIIVIFLIREQLKIESKCRIWVCLN